MDPLNSKKTLVALALALVLGAAAIAAPTLAQGNTTNETANTTVIVNETDGNETDGNQTTVNDTQGNQTDLPDGNESDGNETSPPAGNETDGNQTAVNATQGNQTGASDAELTTEHDGDAKAEICHKPPGNPANAHTIKINASSLEDHLAHGDHEGACTAEEERAHHRARGAARSCERAGAAWMRVIDKFEDRRDNHTTGNESRDAARAERINAVIERLQGKLDACSERLESLESDWAPASEAKENRGRGKGPGLSSEGKGKPDHAGPKAERGGPPEGRGGGPPG